MALLCLMLHCLFGVLFGVRRVSGIEMEPSLSDGELVLFSRVFNYYSVGDAVIFEHDGSLSFSRIEAKSEEGYYLRNDNEDSDVDSRTLGPVPADRLRGKVLSSLKVRNI